MSDFFKMLNCDMRFAERRTVFAGIMILAVMIIDAHLRTPASRQDILKVERVEAKEFVVKAPDGTSIELGIRYYGADNQKAALMLRDQHGNERATLMLSEGDPTLEFIRADHKYALQLIGGEDRSLLTLYEPGGIGAQATFIASGTRGSWIWVQGKDRRTHRLPPRDE